MTAATKSFLGIAAIITGIMLLKNSSKKDSNETVQVEKKEDKSGFVKDFICLLIKNV